MIVSVVIQMVGVGISLKALFEIGTWSDLYFDRDNYCIEKYRQPQKRCDAISALHNLFVSFFGIVIAYTGVVTMFGRKDVDLEPWFMGSMIGFIVDGVILFITATRSNIPCIRDQIKEQWKTQKRVTDENDHEVNMYRGAVRVCDNYPRHDIYFLSVLVAMWCFMTFIY